MTRPDDRPPPVAPPINPDMNPETMLPEAVAEHDLTPGASPELVQAFRMNAEALHRLQEMQQQLVGAVQSSNRSEMMIQSTQALNETFRNLTQVQRNLLDRVEASAHRGPNRLVPLMLLGLLIVIVGGVAVIVESVRQGGGATPIDQARLAEQVRTTYARGREEGAAERAAELARLQTELAAADERIIESQAALDESLRDRRELELGNQSLEFTNQELAKEVKVGRQNSAVRRALEQEIEDLQRKQDATDSVIAAHKADTDKYRRIAQDLRKRIANFGLDLPMDPDYDPAHDPNAPVDSEPTMRPVGAPKVPNVPNVRLPNQRNEEVPAVAKPTSFDDVPTWGNAGAVPPPPVVRRASGSASTGTLPPPPATQPSPAKRVPGMSGSADVELPEGLPPLPAGTPPLVRRDDRVDRRPVATRKVRGVLNGLLERSRDSVGTLYQITNLKGVTSNRLAGMRLIRYDDAQRTPEIITAQDVRVVVDRRRQEVTLFLRNGERVGKARRERIPPEGARVTVARGRDIQPWLNSGLRLIETR